MGSLERRLQALEGRTFDTRHLYPEAHRARTEELRASIAVKLQRVIDEERRKGAPEPSEEQIATNVREIQRALRSKAGWE